MNAPASADFDRRWAAWQAKGRLHDIVTRRRMRWVNWSIAAGLAAALLWMLA